jgi:uncharacterized protein YigE (DUF2233 family)
MLATNQMKHMRTIHLTPEKLATRSLIFAISLLTKICHAAEYKAPPRITNPNDSATFASERFQGAKVLVRTYKINPGHPRAGLTYVVVEATSTNTSPHVATIKQFGDSHKIYQERTPKDAIAAINGGFFGYSQSGNHMSLGFVVANGKRENSRIGWTRGGVFAHSTDKGSRIIPIKKYVYHRTDTEAIQSKPLLVEDFNNGIFREDGERFNRTAIAITRSGNILFAGAFDSFGRGVSLYEMAEFLRAIKALDGSNVRWALAMDGGPGSQIYIPTLKMNFGEQGQNFVPNFLYLK